MGSICPHSLPPGPSGEACGVPTCILHSRYSSPFLMWFAPNSLKMVYLDWVLRTGHPPALGCISTKPQPDPGQEGMGSGSLQEQQPGFHLSRVVLEDTF